VYSWRPEASLQESVLFFKNVGPGAGDLAQWLERLPRKRKALGSVPSSEKKNQKKKMWVPGIELRPSEWQAPLPDKPFCWPHRGILNTRKPAPVPLAPEPQGTGPPKRSSALRSTRVSTARQERGQSTHH